MSTLINIRTCGAYYRYTDSEAGAPQEAGLSATSPSGQAVGKKGVSLALNQQAPAGHLQRRMRSHSLVSDDQPGCEVAHSSEARLQQGCEKP